MDPRLIASDTPLSGLVVLDRLVRSDRRGQIERVYCDRELKPWLGLETIKQANVTMTVQRGAVRGMHMQAPPFAEDKIVTCLAGKVWDVAVDLRRGSSTLFSWHSEVLSGEGHRSLLIPRGFAHGFQALTDDCMMLYFHTAAHSPEAEIGFDALDPRLDIRWPEPITDRSPRDLSHRRIDRGFHGVSI